MFDQAPICPYTGLRSFTEEESLYFKGRDEHIRHATEQLQNNKFLMVTGASGDGKSSLVYAGIIPNARAGFLRSSYTQWCVADFRPERSPFRNLCNALARQLGIEDRRIVESELQHGFSALADLYCNSQRYLDTSSVAWRNASDTEKAVLKRQAANLIIIVDQFEEFFTNPENYHKGIPSRDSNLVLNLLLETAHIALERDLPIYVIFTMRSDYIGQCAAFRSLPEYIGFSQFFVPRLNRAQLQQVIEDPAALSGNRISRRLTERLIHDIAEGVDQLPILQHALNQIWHAADEGAEEMDLIHYAMVGGMPREELPDDQIPPFVTWFDSLPGNIKACYLEPNLQNVLDTHANKLYESAAESLHRRTGIQLDSDVVKDAIRASFTCLTKIDQGRAVRNRMTLQEIHDIGLNGAVDVQVLGKILQIFREPGNTFIRPFITDDPDTLELGNDDVLDITHESLIRNWELLDGWVKVEYHNHSVFLDFAHQVDRWVQNGKSGSFLLSIGPLTFFESWYARVKPNAAWIARYLPDDDDAEVKIAKSEEELRNSREFLRRSARRHFATRAIVKYGPRRIAAILAVVVMFGLSSFGVSSYFRQQNSYVLKQMVGESMVLAASKKVSIEDKAILLAENLRLGLTTPREIARNVVDPVARINALSAIVTALVAQGQREPARHIEECLIVTDSLLHDIPVSLSFPGYGDVLNEVNDFMVTLDLAYTFNPSPAFLELVSRNAERTAAWLMLIAKEKPEGFSDMRNFDMAIEHALNHKALDDNAIAKLISSLSPFEGTPDKWVAANFARDRISERGFFNYGIAFNGLYQELAYLYAASGKAEMALRCVDSLVVHNQKYYDNDYSSMPDHAAHIAATFYKYGRLAEMEKFVQAYCSTQKMDHAEFYRRLVAHSYPSAWVVFRMNFMSFWNRFTNLVLYLGDREQRDFFYHAYRKAILESYTNADERNFYTALSYKDQALDHSVILRLRGLQEEGEEINSLFDSAFYYYNRVGRGFLDRKVSMYNDNEVRPLEYLFVFPDFNTSFIPSEPRGGVTFYSSTRFLEYILENGLFDKVFFSELQLTYLQDWFLEHRPVFANSWYWILPEMDATFMKALEKKISARSLTNRLNFDELYILLGNSLYSSNPDSAVFFYSKAQPDKIFELTVSNGLFGMRTTSIAVGNLAAAGRFDELYKLIGSFRKPVNRSSLYGYAARQLLARGASAAANRLIDSSRAEMMRVENRGVDQPSRFHFPYALAMRDSGADLQEAQLAIRNVAFKFVVQQKICRSMSFHGNLYKSYQTIPLTVSANDKAVFLWNILSGYSDRQLKDETEWGRYNSRHRWWYNKFIVYTNEND